MTPRQLFVALFIVALLVMPLRETLDPDLGWHLATGEYVLQNGIPTSDPFSFTKVGQPWVAHEWLSDAIMALIVRAAGLPGLMIGYALVIALTFWLVYQRTPGQPYVAGFLVLLAALASAITWGARPQMLNLLGMAFFIWVIEGVKDRKLRWWTFWLLPLASALWANLHGGYLIGVAVLLVYTVGEALQLRLPQLFNAHDDRSLGWAGVRWLGGMALASLLASALNPQFIELWIYPFFTLGDNAMQTYIQEWQSPAFQLFPFWPYLLLMALGVLAWLLSPRKPTPTDILLFGGTAAAGLWSARHISLFAVAAAPIVARYLVARLSQTRMVGLVTPPTTPNPNPPVMAFLNVLMLILAVLAGGAQAYNVIARNEAAIAERYPVAAVDYLLTTDLINQPGYNSYNWGGYLIWRGVPVFVDGRADVYYNDFLQYYLQTYQLASNWQQPLDDYAVTYVLIEANHPLATLLTVSPDWQPTYQDPVAVIFTRVNE